MKRYIAVGTRTGTHIILWQHTYPMQDSCYLLVYLLYNIRALLYFSDFIFRTYFFVRWTIKNCIGHILIHVDDRNNEVLSKPFHVCSMCFRAASYNLYSFYTYGILSDEWIQKLIKKKWSGHKVGTYTIFMIVKSLTN